MSVQTRSRSDKIVVDARLVSYLAKRQRFYTVCTDIELRLRLAAAKEHFPPDKTYAKRAARQVCGRWDVMDCQVVFAHFAASLHRRLQRGISPNRCKSPAEPPQKSALWLRRFLCLKSEYPLVCTTASILPASAYLCRPAAKPAPLAAVP